MRVGTRRSLCTTGCSQLVCTHVWSTSYRFTSTTLITCHHSPHTGLDAGHGGGRCTRTYRCAFSDRLDSRGPAMLTSLLEAGIRSARHGLTTAGLITSHALRTTRAGTAHNLIAVGDAVTDLGRLGFRFCTAEAIELLSAEVLVTGHTVTGSELITSHLGRTTDQSAGYAST